MEDRCSELFKLDRVRPAVVADGPVELQIRWPSVLVGFCETRQLAEERTYRFLAAAPVWATTEHAALQRNRGQLTELDQAAAGTKHRRGPRPGPRRRCATLMSWIGCGRVGLGEAGGHETVLMMCARVKRTRCTDHGFI